MTIRPSCRQGMTIHAERFREHGEEARREKVRGSGLWNSNHVSEGYDPAFLDTLANLIGQAERTA